MTLFDHGAPGSSPAGRSIARRSATPISADDLLIELTDAELAGVAGGTGRPIPDAETARRVAIDASND